MTEAMNRRPWLPSAGFFDHGSTGAQNGNKGSSMVDGGTLPLADVGTMGAALIRAAEDGSAGGIRHLRAQAPDVEQSYADLEDTASRMLNGMRSGGVQPQDTVVLHIDDEPLLLGAFWACVLGGYVPMPVTTAVRGSAGRP